MDMTSFRALQDFRSSIPFVRDLFVAYAQPVERQLSSGRSTSYLAIGRNFESELLVDEAGRLFDHLDGAWVFVNSSLRQFHEALRALDSFLGLESGDVARLRQELTSIAAPALEPNTWWALLIEEYDAGVL